MNNTLLFQIKININENRLIAMINSKFENNNISLVLIKQVKLAIR